MIFRNDLITTETADNETDKSPINSDRSNTVAVTTEQRADHTRTENSNRETNNGQNVINAVVERTKTLETSNRDEVPVVSALETAEVAVTETKSKPENINVTSTVAAVTTIVDSSSASKDLIIEIPDALSEKDGIKFTIQTRTQLKEFRKSSFSVIRDHDDFVWLHDRFTENENYAGFIIPPIPPRPNFELSREKLMTLSDGEGHITESEFHQMKQELEAEYLAAFKKTVAMHEVFLSRLAQHSAFKKDVNFQVFLEYGPDLCAKPKSKLETIGSFLKSFDILDNDFMTTVKLKDFDDFFHRRKLFLDEYHTALKECANCVDRMTEKQKQMADSYLKIANHFITLLTINPGKLDKFLSMFVDLVQNIRKTDRRIACDQDLKLSDNLKYYQGDTKAAKELLMRRLRFLAAYESANKALDKARNRNKPTVDVQKAEVLQTKAFERFNLISSQAKIELIDFRNRCLAAFKASLVDLAELEIKHATTKRDFYENALKLFEDK